MITQQSLDSLFARLRIIHRAHWKAPALTDVEHEIKRTGSFIFRIGSNPWVAQIIISDLVRYEVNPQLPPRMLTATLELKKKFKQTV
ncbi:hypothetical protein J4211_05570 [Candidatus Woesearchaeota archaeon]|nr:hypothetical protein [Candidatus Woesearchaeota archaeon]